MLIAGKQCPLCGSLGTIYAQVGEYQLRICCKTLLSWQWGSVFEYEDIYNRSYHTEEQLSGGQKSYSNPERLAEISSASLSRLSVLTSLFSPKLGSTLIDVGTATGILPEVATVKFGMTACGIDPDPVIDQRYSAIFSGTWKDVRGSWDFITLYDVLEHLIEPESALIELASRLNENGIIVVEMPEWDSPHQREFGLKWRHIRPRQHLFLPSKQSAEKLFKKCGLEVSAFYRPLQGSIGKACWFLTKESK